MYSRSCDPKVGRGEAEAQRRAPETTSAGKSVIREFPKSRSGDPGCRAGSFW